MPPPWLPPLSRFKTFKLPTDTLLYSLHARSFSRIYDPPSSPRPLQDQITPPSSSVEYPLDTNKVNKEQMGRNSKAQGMTCLVQ